MIEHLGDITKISGRMAHPVRVIIGGSPCQDLSVAGRRAGLSGERSSLFMEQIRIIKEMRETYGKEYPRYMVWENVPGAFTSNGGEDFRKVLEETVRVADENAVIPRPPQGKWRTSGCIMGDGYSVAWRVLDAQFWGVPQRRRRIALVADFGGESAPEILFERESVSRNTAESGAAREEVAGNAAECAGITNRGAYTGEVAETLRAESHGALPMVVGRDAFNQGCNAKFAPTFAEEIQPPLVAKGAGAVQYGYSIRRLTPLECERLQGYPDGWTDIGAWVDSKGKMHKESTDSARYRACGNSIALPPWRFVLGRLAGHLERGATMASLFDGIGGFPLIWRELGNVTVWQSEIDEFCEAVTKVRFG